MDYIKCILRKETTISFVKCLNSLDFEGDQEKHFFERATTFDDVSLVISFKHFFDIADKIRKGREVGLSDEQLLLAAKHLEEDTCSYLTTLDTFDQESIMKIIHFDYLQLKTPKGNLLEVLSQIQKISHNGQII